MQGMQGGNPSILFDSNNLPKSRAEFENGIRAKFNQARGTEKLELIKSEILKSRYRLSESEFKPHIIYTFTRGPTEVTIDAYVTFSQERGASNLIAFKAEKIHINGQAVGLGIQGGTLRTDDTFQEKLVEFFVDLYKKVNKDISFPVIDFLKDINIIDKYAIQRNDTIHIRDTDIYIENPQTHRYSNKVPIFFKGRYTKKLDDDDRRQRETTKDVMIRADLYIEMERLPGQYKYVARLYFADYKDENPREFATPDRVLSETFVANTSYQEPYMDKGQRLSLRAYLQKSFKNILAKKTEQYDEDDGIKYTARDQMPIPFESERIDPAMRVKEYWTALRQDPPVKAHCVARALQLLNDSAIYNPSTESARSSVCNVKFSLIQNKSLPDPTKTIISSHGISVLVSLFSDKLMAQAAQIVNRPEYYQKIAALKSHFVRVEAEEGDRAKQDAKPGTEAESVKEYLPPFCEDTRTGGTVGEIELRSKSDIQELRDYANRLLKRQELHISKAVKLIFKLFDPAELKKGGFAFHPAIEERGVTAVNAVAKEARDLLIEYYSDCEDIYKGGLFYMNKAIRRQRADKPEELTRRFGGLGTQATTVVRSSAAATPR